MMQLLYPEYSIYILARPQELILAFVYHGAGFLATLAIHAKPDSGIFASLQQAAEVIS